MAPTHDPAKPNRDNPRLHIEELYRFAERLHEKKPACAAWIHERALILDLRHRCHVRPADLATIDHTSDLVRDEHGRITRIKVVARQGRSRVTIDDVPVAPDLAVRIQTYLTVYRTERSRSNVRWLFASCNASGIAQPPHSPRTAQHKPKTSA